MNYTEFYIYDNSFGNFINSFDISASAFSGNNNKFHVYTDVSNGISSILADPHDKLYKFFIILILLYLLLVKI